MSSFLPTSAEGHRQRLRDRFLKGGESAIAEYELLELLLFAAKPRGDVKPLAKALLNHFKTFAQVIQADTHALLEVPGMGPASLVALRMVQAAAYKLLQQQAQNHPLIQSVAHVVDYCRARMQHLTYEEVRLLFLDRHNYMISDELQNKGTLDEAPIYPREILRRVLDLGAASLVMVHNHPSGDPTPSHADLQITKQVQNTLHTVGVRLHDHLIIGKNRYCSLREMGYC